MSEEFFDQKENANIADDEHGFSLSILIFLIGSVMFCLLFVITKTGIELVKHKHRYENSNSVQGRLIERAKTLNQNISLIITFDTNLKTLTVFRTVV